MKGAMLRKVWLLTVDRVRLALPVMLAALLAAYTWWLVQSAPKPLTRPAGTLPATVPDYVMNKARVEQFNAQGQRTSMLQGTTMTHFARDDRLLVDEFRLFSLKPDQPGASVEATAREGLYMATQGVVELRGQARVVAVQPAAGGGAPSSTVFTAEQLKWLVEQQLLTTNRAVRVQGPQGVIQANQLRHDARAGVSLLGGRVTGSFRP